MANQERQGGEAAEVAATPRVPLRELHELGRLVEAGVAGESPCDLLAATANAAKAALKSENHRDGWLFGQRDFIEAVRAIRDINAGGAVETYGATWAERWKALWSGLREALAAYARAAGCEPRAPRLVIEADSISRDWNRPLDTGALTSLFEYCKAAAETAFREEREVVGFRYDSGVYDVPLANHRGIARLETHAERLHKEHGDILETLVEIKAQGEANGAALAGIEARLPQPRKPGRPRNGENKPGLTLADAARITGRAQSTISGWDANPPEGYPGRGDAAAFRKWWNESELNTTIKHQIITAGEVALENARRVASQNGNRQKPARR